MLYRRSFIKSLGLIGAGLYCPFLLSGVAKDTLENQKKLLITANKILANEGVFDAFGHISVRHPNNPKQYIISRSLSPALVELDDLMRYDLDSKSLEKDDHKSFLERYIHGEIYKKRSDVNAVCHHHAPEIIPFSVTGTELKPVVLVAATMGQTVPIWDPESQIPFVSSNELGESFANTLGMATAALLRGHGCTVVGKGIKEVVMTSIYLQKNAVMQRQAMSLGNVKYLSDKEISAISKVLFSPVSRDRAWDYWLYRLNTSSL